jgi:hypothetical protein
MKKEKINDKKFLDVDHRKLIPIWIKEEEERRKIEKEEKLGAIDRKNFARIESLIKENQMKLIDPDYLHKIEPEAKEILLDGIKKALKEDKKIKLPTQYEREQQTLTFVQKISEKKQIIWPNGIFCRDDIFKPIVKNEAEVKCGFNDLEGNPDVNRVENWSIRAYAWGINGGDACAFQYYWRYRIWVPSFDTSKQPDRRLVIDPMAVLTGYYRLMSIPIYSNRYPWARARLYFYTGTWHHHWTGNSYEPEWTGWKRSFDTINRKISFGNILQYINISYPGTQVRTPDHFDPPGVLTQPNPINHYGMVEPYDVVDFYVRPVICASTHDVISYARNDYSLIDVPFVSAEFEEGYLL